MNTDEIRESRIIKIANKVISLKNAKTLASILWDIYQSGISESPYSSVSFSIKCSDNSSFESSKLSIFDENSIINSKKVEYIKMGFYDPKEYKNIYIGITHGNVDWQNEIEVKGKDSLWVNGVIARIKDVLDSVPPQNMFIKKYKLIINSLLALGIGIFIDYILSFFITPSKDPPSKLSIMLEDLYSRSPFFKYFFKYFFAMVVGYVIGLWPITELYSQLRNLWPSIEIQIGPEHTYIEKRRRKILISILVIGAGPLLVSVVYDIIKAFY